MTTGLAVFDTSIQDTNLWLKHIEARLGHCERQEAYAALRAVLHALRDRLPAQAAVNFAAQLPMIIRGLYFEGWTLPEKPARVRTLEEFCDAISALLPPKFRFDPAMSAKAVFTTAAERMSTGETAKVMAQLPEAICGLWPKATSV